MPNPVTRAAVLAKIQSYAAENGHGPTIGHLSVYFERSRAAITNHLTRLRRARQIRWTGGRSTADPIAPPVTPGADDPGAAC